LQTLLQKKLRIIHPKKQKKRRCLENIIQTAKRNLINLINKIMNNKPTETNTLEKPGEPNKSATAAKNTTKVPKPINNTTDNTGTKQETAKEKITNGKPRRKRTPSILNPVKLCLEPTFSLAEVGKYLGIKNTVIHELIKFGEDYGAKLHPARGGLYPTYKGLRHRRIPLSAIQRHINHMARLNGTPNMPLVKLVEIKYTTIEEALQT
jgi:hypothetical protein